MIAQQMAQDRPSIFRRMILVGTAPRGGEDIMHLEKPSLAKHLSDPKLRGYAVLQKIFFAPTESSQKAGETIEAVYGRAKANGALTVSEGGIIDFNKGKAALIRDSDVGSYIMFWQPPR